MAIGTSDEKQLKLDCTDKGREGLTWQKALQFARLFFVPSASHATAKVDRFEQIDLQAISKMIGRKITGVILDVDDCIAPHHGEILPQNLVIIRDWVAAGVTDIVFSNMQKSDRYAPLEAMGIEVHTGEFSKPDRRGFEACLEKLGTERESTVMIGDNFATDGGAIQAKIPFIKVAPLTNSERKPSFKRRAQVAFRKVIDSISAFHDRRTGRRVWTPSQSNN